MKKILPAMLLLWSVPFGAYAIDMGAVVKAQVVLGQINQVVDKYAEVQQLINAGTIELEVAEPTMGSSGKFMLPFDDAGNLTAWADKALTAQAGAAVGAAAGEKAAGVLAAKVPFGGFLAGAAKDKAKEAGAVTAIGGWDFIRENSTLSFDSLEDYSVYLHSRFNGLPGYEGALAAAMAIYPKLEKSHKASVDRAYRDARKQAKKLAKR
ncbi:MAG: hypothetical protein ACFHX7_07515 [Pseudomonadota bacterium]